MSSSSRPPSSIVSVGRSSSPSGSAGSGGGGSERVVVFPPRDVADFAIHYEATQFHVHRFVLCHHSAYLRAYFDELAQLSKSDARAAKRAKRCDHPHIAHCIHFGQQTELVDRRPIALKDMHLFLRHLYFSTHYCYPPFLPKTDIDHSAASPPLSLTFPPVPPLDWASATTPMRCSAADGAPLHFNVAVLALARYLGCEAMMAQCEAVLATQVDWAERGGHGAWLAARAVQWLKYADCYQMRGWRAACIEHIAAADDSVLESDEYRKARQQWDKALALEVFEAAMRGRDCKVADLGREQSPEVD